MGDAQVVQELRLVVWLDRARGLDLDQDAILDD
jgi:hypothetical protein